MTLAGAYPPPFRRAWLDLYGDGTVTVPVENYGAGYFCSNLDLGPPAIRAVVTPRPDASGEDDRTAYMAGRVVTINISALTGAGAVIDSVPGLFGRFMVPAARPTLHYVLNRPGNPERTLGLRPAAFAWPLADSMRTDIQLQFEAPDPVARAPVAGTTTAWAGSSGAGRVYPLAYPRSYPTGGGQANGTINSPGDVAVSPRLAIYGPITHPQVTFSGPSTQTLAFVAGYQIAAGAYVAVDCLNRTAYLNGDPTQSALNQIDWAATPGWPTLAPGVAWTMALVGDPTGLVTSGVTQCQATWNDGYLT